MRNPSHRSPYTTACTGLVGLFLNCAPAMAQIATDGTVGPAQSLNGPDFVISQDLGTRSGDNLFHSFSDFNVHNGESATFTGANDINNVISRVTGGKVSTIDGVLRSRVGRADFYFINPAGVMFGPNANIDVPAAFHVGTADDLRFADGAMYSAVDPAASTLTVAPPQAFGFLGTNKPSLTLDGGSLSFATGNSVSLAGGELLIRNGQVVNQGGEIRATAMGNTPGTVPLSGPAPTDASGNLTVDSAVIDVSGDGGGHIVIRGGAAHIANTRVVAGNRGATNAAQGIDIATQSLVLDVNSLVTADSFSSGRAGPIQIRTEQAMEVRNGSIVETSAYAAGDSAGVTIHAGSLLIDGAGFVTGVGTVAESGSSGNAGMVEVTVDDLLDIRNEGALASFTSSASNGGKLSVQAEHLTIDAGGTGFFTGIQSEALSAMGKPGDIDIVVNDTMELNAGGRVRTATSLSEANASNIGIRAGSLLIDGGGSTLTTGIVSRSEFSSSGDSGDIDVVVDDDLRLTAGGQIVASTETSGNGGKATVSAASISIDGAGIETGIIGRSQLFASGDAGAVQVTATHGLEVLDEGAILSSTYSSGDAGSVTVTAEDLVVDGKGETATIGSRADIFATGNANSVDVEVTRSSVLLDGGRISATSSAGTDAGSVTVTARDLLIDGRGSAFTTGITSDTLRGPGNAGSVSLTIAETLEIRNGGELSTNSLSGGDAGAVSVDTRDLLIDGMGTPGFTGISSRALQFDAPVPPGESGNIHLTTSGEAKILQGGQITTDTWIDRDAGSISLDVNNLIIDRQGASFATGISSDANAGSGNGGLIEVNTRNDLVLLNGGSISSRTVSSGNAGDISIDAAYLSIERGESRFFTGIANQAGPGASGYAGDIRIIASEALSIIDGGEINSSTFSLKDAGSVTVEARKLVIDGQGSEFFTGIASSTETGSYGNAGMVDIWAREMLVVAGEGTITTRTLSSGNAGYLTVEAGRILIEGDSNIGSSARAGSSGNAGALRIVAKGEMQIRDGGIIQGATFSTGKANSVTVEAGSLLVDGANVDSFTGITSQAGDGSGGSGGPVSLTVHGDLEIRNGGVIGSSTFGPGNAGTVMVTVDGGHSLVIDGANLESATGIASQAGEGSSGNAGIVSVTIQGDIELRNGGHISTSTRGKGNAGTITVDTNDLWISELYSGINAAADRQASGEPGNIAITAREVTVADQGHIAIEARPLVEAPQGGSVLSIDANDLSVVSGGRISTRSTENVPAGALQLEVANKLNVDGGSITTAANRADGGSIHIDARRIRLHDSPVTTSVTGEQPGLAGGDIDVRSKTLILETGFIQANSNSPGGRGGDIRVNTPTLIASRGNVLIGGETVRQFEPGIEGFNVIQAVAPEGVSGTVDVSSPELDISRTIAQLNPSFLDISKLTEDVCASVSGHGSSSLSAGGRGGLPLGPMDARPVFFGSDRLDKVLGPPKQHH